MKITLPIQHIGFNKYVIKSYKCNRYCLIGDIKNKNNISTCSNLMELEEIDKITFSFNCVKK